MNAQTSTRVARRAQCADRRAQHDSYVVREEVEGSGYVCAFDLSEAFVAGAR